MSVPSRRTKIVIAFFALVVGGYVVGRFGLSSRAIPPSFDDARSQSAAISDDIVGLSNQIAADLGRVSQLDKEGKLKEAIELTEQISGRIGEIKGRATDLTGQLEKMTGAASDIRSEDARALALQAVTHRLTVVSRILSYSEYVSQLLHVLQLRFAGLPPERGAAGVSALVDQANGEVTAIGNFNRLANEAMQKFDETVRK